MTDVDRIDLPGGTSIPQLGYGVFQIPPDETEAAVTQALDVGYRSIDTAAAYGNEPAVGRAVARHDVERADLFITTKLWNADHGHDNALAAFDASLGRLGMDYVDLYLIHWPVPSRDLYLETWQALEEILSSGRARAIGVSNFHISHLQRILDASDVVPAVNQVELHPNLAQSELREFHAAHGIATEAWSPLAQGALMDDPVITGIATRHGATPAQVVLAWHLALGIVVIPKSVTAARIAENFASTSVTLDDDDMAAIATLDRGGRIGPDPDEMAVT